MKLTELAAAAGLDRPAEAEITALACRSTEVTPGALFAALKGARADGRDYIPEAVARGAAAVLCAGAAGASVPVLTSPEPREALARMAAAFYGRPGDAMTLIAVTGTKGKTTTAYMLRDILLAGGRTVGMIGTLGAFLGREQLAPAANTTPEPIALHALLRRMADAGATHVVMEASSQAMKLHRLAGLTFEIALFLNLSPDHIGPGEHADLAEYRACKAALFRQCRLALGNAADPAWPLMAAQAPAARAIAPLPIRRGAGLTTEVGPFTVPMPGTFNGENARAAIAAARALGVEEAAIAAGLAVCRVPGRCELCPVPAPFSVVIDYAHNGAAMRSLLSALRPCGRIIAVFGAGGDRPPMRRHDLARAAAGGADFAVLTADNPRSEDPTAICAQIAGAMPDLPHVIVPDRAEAIRRALDMAGPGDVVALLGKGHEAYMEVSGRRIPFSERAVVEDYFRGREA